MFVLLLFSFLAGIVTVLSPCILPVLPIVLAGSVTTGKRRPFGIVTGFVLSFTFFTLFLSAIVRATGLPPEALRTFAILVIGVFGISLLIPKFQAWLETMFSRLANASPLPTKENGFTSGFFMGISLGLVWAPCVGPILASIIALALTGTVTASTFLITLAYSMGTAIPMFAILYGGRSLLLKTPWLTSHTQLIQKTFGVLMVIIAIAMYLNLDRKFQTYILTVFPAYGTGLTKIETMQVVTDALARFQKKPVDMTNQGKPMFNVLQENASRAPELLGGQKWFNSEPLTLSGLKGKVVMIDFWTYTCINCIRTLPYTTKWYETYKDKGFVLIGVHTPEFEFEKDADNVKKAIADFNITYPVVQDNEYAIWNAYANRYWPAHYLIDRDGKIRDTHFGEGEYDATEKNIVELLNETGANLSSANISNPTYQVRTQTPETYLGTARLGALSSPESPTDGATQNYTAPNPVPYNTFAFSGTWTESAQRAMPAAGATLTYHFDATNVYLVMRPKVEGTVGKIQIYLDGALVSTITVDTDRLYDIVKLPTQGEHILQLKFLDGNLELYAFTFG